MHTIILFFMILYSYKDMIIRIIELCSFIISNTIMQWTLQFNTRVLYNISLARTMYVGILPDLYVFQIKYASDLSVGFALPFQIRWVRGDRSKL